MNKKIVHIITSTILMGFLIPFHPLAASRPQWVENEPATARMVQTFNCTFVEDVPVSECEALVALYGNTNGEGWVSNSDWLTSPMVGDWFGVGVFNNHVTRLVLPQNQLAGPIPSQLGDLIYLEYLVLTRNQLTGQIPPELKNLYVLKDISLGFNQLSGEIPAWLGNLTALDSLALGENQFSGNIPIELGKLVNLTSLLLFHNHLSGPIPAELGNLTKLVHLHLNLNQLSGSIPPDLGKMKSLQHLWLSYNKLSGGIPTELGAIASLKSLELDNNQLIGSIPSEIGNLSNLEWINLQNNQLSGSIPNELGNLSNLTILWLYSNQLGGDVPTSFTNLTNLSSLDLGYNHLTVPATPQELADFLALRDPDWYLTQAVEETLPGDTGGTMLSNDGNTEIVIPPDAMTAEVTFTFVPQAYPNHDTGSLSMAGKNFELSAQDSEGTPVTSFMKPIIITISYDETSLGDISEEDLSLYYWDSDMTTWLDVVTTCPAGKYTRSLEDDWLSVPICHLSEFTLVGEISFKVFLPMIYK